MVAKIAPTMAWTILGALALLSAAALGLVG